MTAVLVLVLVAGLFLLAVTVRSVRVVKPYQRGIVEQLGKYKETVEPGLHLIVPFAQSLTMVDMREQVVDVPPQEVITSDNVVVSVDAVVYYEPTDPSRLLYNIANFIVAVTKLAQTNMRNVIGDMTLDEALTSRDKLNLELREILDSATDKWGVKVVRVEIQRIDPPPDVMAAMHEQMKSERNRRAQVTAADGFREAAIMRAEGEKQAAILAAEGVKQRQVLEAQGEADAIRSLAQAEQYRAQTVAAGEAAAIEAVYGAIHAGAPTNDLLAIKYLEALGRIADGQATKIYLPLDTGGMAGALAGVAELFTSAADRPGSVRPPADQPLAQVTALSSVDRVKDAASQARDRVEDAVAGAQAAARAGAEAADEARGTAAATLHRVSSGTGAWMTDPTGRFATRWFDGTHWTSHVADAVGARSEDPYQQ